MYRGYRSNESAYARDDDDDDREFFFFSIDKTTENHRARVYYCNIVTYYTSITNNTLLYYIDNGDDNNNITRTHLPGDGGGEYIDGDNSPYNDIQGDSRARHLSFRRIRHF